MKDELNGMTGDRLADSLRATLARLGERDGRRSCPQLLETCLGICSGGESTCLDRAAAVRTIRRLRLYLTAEDADGRPYGSLSGLLRDQLGWTRLRSYRLSALGRLLERMELSGAGAARLVSLLPPRLSSYRLVSPLSGPQLRGLADRLERSGPADLKALGEALGDRRADGPRSSSLVFREFTRDGLADSLERTVARLQDCPPDRLPDTCLGICSDPGSSCLDRAWAVRTMRRGNLCRKLPDPSGQSCGSLASLLGARLGWNRSLTYRLSALGRLLERLAEAGVPVPWLVRRLPRSLTPYRAMQGLDGARLSRLRGLLLGHGPVSQADFDRLLASLGPADGPGTAQSGQAALADVADDLRRLADRLERLAGGGR